MPSRSRLRSIVRPEIRTKEELRIYVVRVTILCGVLAVVSGEFDSAVAVTDALNERFGLLVIIVLGETVTGVVSGLTTDPTSAHKLAVGVVCVLVGFGSWWTYFDFVGHREPPPLAPSLGCWAISRSARQSSAWARPCPPSSRTPRNTELRPRRRGCCAPARLSCSFSRSF